MSGRGWWSCGALAMALALAIGFAGTVPAFAQLGGGAGKAPPAAPPKTTPQPQKGFAVPPAITRRVPSEDYFLGFTPYYSGDYAVARRAFQEAARGGIKTGNNPWIDSICYQAMLGECFYQMGDLNEALKLHTSAVQIFLAYRGWLLGVEFPPGIDVAAGGSRVAIPWGNSKRATQIGRYPDTMQAFAGRTDAENALAAQQGGVIASPQLFPLHVVEIVRCLTTSLRRRAELLGPTGSYDQLNTAVVEALSGRPAPANHWSQAWIDVQLGWAYFTAGKREQAASEFQKGLLAGGQFEHHLSCSALLGLGHLALQQEQYVNALDYYLEATYSAGVYGQFDILQEAFTGAVTAHRMSGKKELFAPLVPAAQWARRQSVSLEATLLTLAAQSFGAAGDPARGLQLVGEARRVIGRHDLGLGRVGVANQFELARLQFQTGNVAAGNTALATALAFQTKNSLRLFQTGLADALYVSGSVPERTADQLYAELLHETRPEDWARDPFDTLAVDLTPRPGPMERWMDLAMRRNDSERALEIADQARRQKFHGSLPLGGRLLALRWVLDAPPETLPERASLQRRDLLARFPGFAELQRQADAIQAAIAKEPVVPADEDAAKTRADQLTELAKISAAQEVILHDIAVERMPADAVFPPPAKVKELQAKLPQGTLVLAYTATSRGLLGFAINSEKFATFPIATPAKVKTDVSDLLKRIGNRDGNQPLDPKDFKDETWRSIARRLAPILTNDTPASAWDNYQELVIVPDGFLWYLPFETLLVGEEDAEQPLARRVRIRYAPTLGLAVPDARPQPPLARTALVAGRLYPRDDVKLTIDAVETLQAALPDSVRLPNRLPGPSSLVAKFCDRLVVYHDLDDVDKGPYDWSPVQIDRAKPNSSLAAYFPLPWGGPSQYVYPGFHTPAENGLKKGATATGDDVFLSLCGLMSTGARTVMISRWRVGGQSTFGLMQEFVQELPHAPATSAWQRSVELLTKQPLEPAREPRLRWPTEAEPPPAEHPFFWAGYLLADTGVVPAAAGKAK